MALNAATLKDLIVANVQSAIPSAHLASDELDAFAGAIVMPVVTLLVSAGVPIVGGVPGNLT